jgi:phosphoenolpyruvate carboxykinase (ATP)
MPLHPSVYSKLLGEKLNKHGVQVWLLNTGWTGGPYGEGKRMKLAYTRRMVSAVLNNELDGMAFMKEPFFGLAVPQRVPDVPDEVLLPRATWADKEAYDVQAGRLVEMFRKNFEQFADGVTAEIKAAGPR